MIATSLAHELVKDEVLQTLAIFNVAWLVATRVAHFVFLRLADTPRAAEIARVLGGVRFSLFLAAILAENALERIDDLRDLGSFGDFALTAGIVALRLLAGILLALSFTALLRVLHSEFLERQLRSYGRVRERNTAMLLYSLVVPLGFLVSIAFVFSQFHLDVASYLVTLGGLSVALGLAIQRLLTNVFAGLSLALDAPFSRSDLIRVGQGDGEGDAKGRLYEVQRRGIRVTTVRDITTHETVYLPNNKLAEEPLVEVTRPTDDLRVVIDVGVPYENDIREVRETLLEVALGHPHLVEPFEKKQKAIEAKVARLFLRGQFDECIQHWIELGRLRVEQELNKAVSELGEELQSAAREVDRLESKGFSKDEKGRLGEIAGRLTKQGEEITTLTTVWLLMVRNGVARGRTMPDDQPSLAGYRDDEKDEVIKLYKDAVAGPDSDEEPIPLPPAISLRDLGEETAQFKLEVELNQERMRVLSKGLASLQDDIEEFDPPNKRPPIADDRSPDPVVAASMRALRIANGLANSVGIHPEIPAMRSTYRKPAEDWSLDHDIRTAAWEVVEDGYVKIGETAVERIVTGVRERVKKDKLSIEECRSRSEDLYRSEEAVLAMLDDPFCEANLGVIVDDDERSDLAELFRVWGDKAWELTEHLEAITRSLKSARTTTIDTELRELATSLKESFKDPFPSWKQPIVSVEGFDESSIHVAMKVYVDNVRMDKYMRMYATLTNLRMRVIERLGNRGIRLPYPVRDVRVTRWDVGDGDLSGASQAPPDEV